MLHRAKKVGKIYDDKWNGLGGKMEAGETPEECVIREVREESGLKIRRPKLKGVLTFPSFDGVDDWIVFVFTADEFSGRLLEKSPEGRLEWIPDGRVPKLNIWEGDRYFLEHLNGRRFFTGKFVYRNGEYVKHTLTFY
ncbi:MAG: DNA mismatch repair protein MutT [Elusimicrobia bacterium RIFCSPLOWO2_01_FULL_60_11]|nr:MAG: DNA mismatch repair protein MutT [Elusimicrobia bacterium RIFCSPLOWO2_01_FULL_60_11]